MKKNLPILLIASGGLINLADAYSAKSNPTGGIFYGSEGVFTKIPALQKLPLNIGAMLMILGGLLFVWNRYGRSAD